MQTFVKTTKAVRQVKPTESTQAGPTLPRKPHDVHAIHQLQQAIGNRGVRQMLQTRAAGPSLLYGIHTTGVLRIARSPGPGSGSKSKLRSEGLSPAEIKLLNEVRSRLIPPGERSTAIVGVLIAEDGRQFEFKSGGGQGFSSHVEGKATAKMEELGIKKATLLVEKEPCQICDRSVYPADTGPETPLKSSKTGKAISRQTPKINTALPIGTQLTVVDPESASFYRGVKTSPAVPVKPPGKPGGKQSGGGMPEGAQAPKPRSSKALGPVPNVRPAPKPAAGGGAAAMGESATREVRAAARAAAKEAATDFKVLRFAKGLTAAVHIVSFIGTLATLDSFATMTSNALAGKGFILTRQIAEAEKLRSEASSLRRDYAPFSEALTEKQFTFLRAAGDPLAAGQAASSIGDLDTSLEGLKRDLAQQIGRVNAALKEAKTKQKAAEAILNDPQASAALAAATFGTAELAQLFAAAQDLERVAGALGSAAGDLTYVLSQVGEDSAFISGWFSSLFAICRKGGRCSLTVLEIPFVGTSRIHWLPGDAE